MTPASHIAVVVLSIPLIFLIGIVLGALLSARWIQREIIREAEAHLGPNELMIFRVLITKMRQAEKAQSKRPSRIAQNRRETP